MKKKVRLSNNNPFYSNEPAVSRTMIADQGITASLGNQTPKMVDKKPGRLSGLAGFESKSKPPSKGIKISAGKPPGPSKVPSQGGGHLRMSGNSSAHRLGFKPK